MNVILTNNSFQYLHIQTIAGLPYKYLYNALEYRPAIPRNDTLYSTQYGHVVDEHYGYLFLDFASPN